MRWRVGLSGFDQSNWRLRAVIWITGPPDRRAHQFSMQINDLTDMETFPLMNPKETDDKIKDGTDTLSANQCQRASVGTLSLAAAVCRSRRLGAGKFVDEG
jgi:hypothetical protein